MEWAGADTRPGRFLFAIRENFMMRMRPVIVPTFVLGLLVGCSGGTNRPLTDVKDQNDPAYGASVAEKLKRDLGADPATAKQRGGAKKGHGK